MKLSVLIKGDFGEEGKRIAAEAMIKKLMKSGVMKHRKTEISGDKGTSLRICAA